MRRVRRHLAAELVREFGQSVGTDGDIPPEIVSYVGDFLDVSFTEHRLDLGPFHFLRISA